MQIPKEIQSIIKDLEKRGFEAYVVGGCVRDFLLGKKPKDWDITTSAKPEEIQKIFPESFYNNKFGTVTVVNKDTKNEAFKNIEITTYRVDVGYTQDGKTLVFKIITIEQPQQVFAEPAAADDGKVGFEQFVYQEFGPLGNDE